MGSTLPSWVMVLHCAELWHLPPWVVSGAKLGDKVMLWYERQLAWGQARQMRQNG